MRRQRILIVDDEEAVREMLADFLEEAGYAAFTAAGRQGLDIVKATPPDLILLDLLMPEMSGFEFLSQLHEVSGGARIPVIIVSGLGECLARAVDAGVARIAWGAEIVAKPIDLADLLARIEQVLSSAERSVAAPASARSTSPWRSLVAVPARRPRRA